LGLCDSSQRRRKPGLLFPRLYDSSQPGLAFFSDRALVRLSYPAPHPRTLGGRFRRDPFLLHPRVDGFTIGAHPSDLDHDYLFHQSCRFGFSQRAWPPLFYPWLDLLAVVSAAYSSCPCGLNGTALILSLSFVKRGAKPWKIFSSGASGR